MSGLLDYLSFSPLGIKGIEEENLALSWEWPDVTVHTLPRSYGSSLSGEHGSQMLS